ncbi:MAG: hypothetical protein ACRDYZ_07530 [Acidimicrobiales bacterium]
MSRPPWLSRRDLRLRRAGPGAGADTQRATEATRDRAARRLARAQHEGRFASSDLYECRMEALLTARRQADVDRLVGDLEDLVPAHVRSRMLRVIARAHADGRLDLDDFDHRTDRCLEPLRRDAADALVADLGYRLVRPGRPLGRPGPWARAARRIGVPAAVGGVVGTALVAVPAGLDLPGGLAQWLPLALGTGAFSAVGTGIATLAWLSRPPSRRPLQRP